jgi:hypothetical protein
MAKYKMLVDQQFLNSDVVLKKGDIIESSDPYNSCVSNGESRCTRTNYGYLLKTGKASSISYIIGAHVQQVSAQTPITQQTVSQPSTTYTETDIPKNSPELIKTPTNLVVRTGNTKGFVDVYTIAQVEAMRDIGYASGAPTRLSEGDVVSVIEKRDYLIGTPNKSKHTYWVTTNGLAIASEYPTSSLFKITTDTKTSTVVVDIKPQQTLEESVTQSINESPIGTGIRKAQIAFAVVGWGVFAYIAYKKWGKSDLWKAGIAAFGLFGAYNTYTTFSKTVFQIKKT